MTSGDHATPGPALAVIVPHYNDVVRLSRCLAALLPQVAGDAVEVVVVDNGSTQSLDPVRAAHPGLRIVAESEKGAAPARNRGVAVTTAPGLAFLDADCVPAEGWLDRARAVAAQDARVTGGRVTVFDETPGPRSGAEAFETVFAFDQADYIGRKGFSVSANLVTTRKVFAATGPFVAGVSEDVDWCRRATAGGARLVYDAALVVAHPTRGNWSELARKWRRLTDEMAALNGPGSAARARWAARGLAMPASALVHAPRILCHPGLRPAEKARALATLARLRMLRGRWMLTQAVRGVAHPATNRGPT